MIPKSVEYICENCSTNIDDNWWWCPVCGNNVSLLEVQHYTKFQRLIITLQDLFSCTSKPDTKSKRQSNKTKTKIEETDEVDTRYRREPPHSRHTYLESYV